MTTKQMDALDDERWRSNHCQECNKRIWPWQFIRFRKGKMHLTCLRKLRRQGRNG